MINSATGHGYFSEPKPKPLRVRVGDKFRLKCALGIYESRVLRPRPDSCFDTVIERWVTDVPAFRQGFVGSIETLSRDTILAAVAAP